MKVFIGILLLVILYSTSARNFYGNLIPGSRYGVRRPSPSPTPVSNRRRLCRYGVNYWDCCRGWRKDHFGVCNPVCQKECVHGECVAPDRCECHEGWMGPTCDKDFNECAVRPCQHRCMNQPGSYRCYCEHGYALMPDSHRCQRDKRCLTKHCSFACRRKGRKIECACPPGWELAPDGKNCRDIDECSTGTAKCEPNLRCQNSMGDYICLCPLGQHYEYNTILKKYKCENDKGCAQDPCFPGVTCTPQAKFNVDTRFPVPESVDLRLYRCGPCPEGFEGDGETCTPKIGSTDAPRRITPGFSTESYQSRTYSINSTRGELRVGEVGILTFSTIITGEATAVSGRTNGSSSFGGVISRPEIFMPYNGGIASTTSATSTAHASTSLPKTTSRKTTEEPTTTKIPTTTSEPTTTTSPTTTPEPTTTTIPTTTPEPTTTTIPTTTCKPTTTTSPTTTPEPTTTTIPTTTPEPTTTTVPTTTSEPTTTTLPTTTPEPTTTTIPTTTPEPTTTTIPTTTSKPTTTTLPTTTFEPTTTTIPTTTPEPTTTTIPTTTSEPTTTTLPTTTPEPTTTIPTTTPEPTTTTIPTTTSEPTTTTLPTTTPEPTTTTMPTTTPEPTTTTIPTTTSEPTTTTIPTTTPEPTTTTIPTTTSEPTTTTSPTTTPEPTTTTIPTTTPEPTTTAIPTTTSVPTTTTIPTTTPEPTTTAIPTTTSEPTTTTLPTTTPEPTTTTIPTTTPEPTTTTIPTTTTEATTTPVPTTTPQPTTTPPTTAPPPQELIIFATEADDDSKPIYNADVALYRLDNRGNLLDPLIGTTDEDGLVALPVPEGEHFVVYINKPGYIENSGTFLWVPFGRNMLNFKLRPAGDVRIENVFTWYSGFNKKRDFDDYGAIYTVELPPGALDIEEGRDVRLTGLPVNVSDPEDLRRAPELLANSLSPKKNGGNVTHGLEVYGMAEFRIGRADTSEGIATESLDVLRAVKLVIPITGSTEGLSNFQKITAWYFDESMGYWREEGKGTVKLVGGKWQWEYLTKRFAWWAVGRKFMETSCAIVRTCYDPDCNEPAPFIPVTMTGTDFAYTTEKLTDVKGKTCFNFKLGGSVRFSSHCEPKGNTVDLKSKKKSPLCCHSNFGRQLVKHYVKSKKKSNKCPKVTIHISDSSISHSCPDPSIMAEKGVIYSYTGKAVGSIATASCKSKRREIAGVDTRICLECGRWSGLQPRCVRK